MPWVGEQKSFVLFYACLGILIFVVSFGWLFSLKGMFSELVDQAQANVQQVEDASGVLFGEVNGKTKELKEAVKAPAQVPQAVVPEDPSSAQIDAALLRMKEKIQE